MPDANAASDHPDRPGYSVAAHLLCEIVTRLDRPPGIYDQACEQIALKLEEIGSSFYSAVTPALRPVIEPLNCSQRRTPPPAFNFPDPHAVNPTSPTRPTN